MREINILEIDSFYICSVQHCVGKCSYFIDNFINLSRWIIYSSFIVILQLDVQVQIQQGTYKLCRILRESRTTFASGSIDILNTTTDSCALPGPQQLVTIKIIFSCLWDYRLQFSYWRRIISTQCKSSSQQMEVNKCNIFQRMVRND